MLKIALLGQAAFGQAVYQALLENNATISAVFCPPDTPGKPDDPLKTAAQQHATPVHQFKRLRDQPAIDAFRAIKPDLAVMAFVTDIVPIEIIHAPTQGTINFHPSLLPRHRGPSSINWPIIQGETETGLTIFWPDAGLDTGPILLQKKVPIKPDDTLGTLYFDNLFHLGVKAMVEAVDLVTKGNAPKIPQDETKATYESWCKATDVLIDWTKPVDEIYNLIRGSDPTPGSGTTFRGEPIKFFNASIQRGAANTTPGEVTTVNETGFQVAAPGGAIQITRVQPNNAKKIPAPEWANTINLKPTDQFGS